VPTIEIYTSPFCPYCHRAKSLLKKKGAEFTEVDVMMSPSKRKEMQERSNGATSVPQIFIDGRGVGGFDDIAALDRAGELDPLLQGQA
jgi:glutaredoxin 3